MQKILLSIDENKKRLDAVRPLSPILKKQMDDFFTLEVAYQGAALDGNTLSRIESLLAIEQGFTSKGKTISEHLEVINLALAFDIIRKSASLGQNTPFLSVMMQVFDRVIDKLHEDQKGRYRTGPARLKGLTYVAPESAAVSGLLEQFTQKLAQLSDAKAPFLAAFVHGEIVKIAPFGVGNARVARMMAQYVLLEKGYSPMLIAPNQRQDYLEALDAYVRFGKADQYTRFMVRACERGAEAALSLVEESGTSMRVPKLLKIGDLAAASKESIVTIRHWAKEGILTVSEHTPGGYMLFSDTMIERVREVRRLQKKGMSLSEIKTQ